MKAYLYVSFVLIIIGIFARVGLMAISEYPRTQRFKLGEDVANVLLKLPLLMWAAYLLWGIE